MAWRAMAGSILAGCAVEPGRYRPARWRLAGCWAVGHTDSGSGAGEGGSDTQVLGEGLVEDEHVFVDDQMRWFPSGPCLADLGELPKRRSSDEPAVSDRGMEDDEVLEIGEPGLVGEPDGGGREIIQATGPAGIFGYRPQQPTRTQQVRAPGQHLRDPRPPALAADVAEVGRVAGVVEGVFGT